VKAEMPVAKKKQKKASQKELTKKRTDQLNKIREWAKAYDGDQEQLVREMSATFNMAVPKAIKELQAAGAVLDPELVKLLLKETNKKAEVDYEEARIRRIKARYLKYQNDLRYNVPKGSGSFITDSYYMNVGNWGSGSILRTVQELRFEVPVKIIKFSELSEENKEYTVSIIDKIIASNIRINHEPTPEGKEMLLDLLCKILFGDLDCKVKMPQELQENGAWEKEFNAAYKTGKGTDWVHPFVLVIPDDELSVLFDAHVDYYNGADLIVDEDENENYGYE
jgi:hypothetical protein